MRRVLFALPMLLLIACDMADFATKDPVKPVDVATLGPLSGKEQALLVAADGERRNGDTSSAEHDYLEAVAASTGHVQAHLALADLYQSQGQLPKAQTVLERAHALQPNHPGVDYLLGKIAILNNQPDQALTYFHQGLDKTPDDLNLLNGSGTAHDMLRQNAIAQKLYLRAIALHPEADLSMVRTNLAMSYLLSNQPKKAVDILKPEVKKPGASAVTRHDLALAYGMLGKNAEAKAVLNGEMTEEDRQQVITRLQRYLAQPQTTPPPMSAVAAH